MWVKPSDLRNDTYWRKTRMKGLSDSEKILMMRSAVLTQSTHVTDRQTDGIGMAYTRYSMLSRVKMKTEPYRNRGFFLKTEPKSTDLAKCETVTTLVMIISGKAQNLSLYKVIHSTWAAKYRSTLTCGVLTAVIVGCCQSRPTALAVIPHHKILI